MSAGHDVAEILDLLGLLTPYEVPGFTRRRFGNRRSDGGYVLLEELLSDQPVISAGIGRQISFDLEMAERGHVVHMFDHTIVGPPHDHPGFRFTRRGIGPSPTAELTSIAEVVDGLATDRDDLVLKMDIEGFEWPVLRTMPRAVLRRFGQITLELHALNAIATDAQREPKRVALRNLARDFTVFHVHANNFHATQAVLGVPVHPLLELSLVRTDLVSRAPNRTVYPSLLDPPNVVDKPEVALWFHPFLPTGCPVDHLAAEMRRCAAQLDRSEAMRAGRESFLTLKSKVLDLEQRLAAAEARDGDPAPPA